FAVVTAVGRTSVGWRTGTEMHQAPLTIYRPRQIYVGEGCLRWSPRSVGRRLGGALERRCTRRR
ncbi:hypothetical protein CQA77_30370, partial [Klebsiella pneumoniae]